MGNSKEYAVQMKDITIRFGSYCALNNVRLDVEKGSVHAILGENGAGKTTLMNILYGLYQKDSGEICLYGKKEEIKNPGMAIAKGIGMVHQHFMLVENFTVTQNIILGMETVKGAGMLDMKRARKEVEDIVEKYGLQVDPDAVISDISVGMQQRVEILKALYRGAEILILDEPTRGIDIGTKTEIQKLVLKLAKEGKGIIFISSEIEEMLRTCTKMAVLRDGAKVGEITESLTQESVMKAIAGGGANE